jgi:hypothetical protein
MNAVRLCSLGLLVLAGLPCAAGAFSPSLEPRVEVATCTSASGSLLARPSPVKPWQYVEQKGAVHSRDVLLALPGTQAKVQTLSGAVELTLWGNLPGLDAFAGLQSSVTLHESRSYDLDLSLQAGRVVLRNTRAKGGVRVWVRLPAMVEGRFVESEAGCCELRLANPGDEVALEIYGRWPRGVPFRKSPQSGDLPLSLLQVIALKGKSELRAGTRNFTLDAPPGLALLTWDSFTGLSAGPVKLEKLPSWADPKQARPDAAAEMLRANLDRLLESYQKKRSAMTPYEVLSDLLAAADTETDAARATLQRQFATLGLAALEELPRVAEAMDDSKRADVRDAAVLALRAWIGDRAGRDAVLYQVLRENLTLPEAQADTVMQLLHSPFAADQPETFTTLLAYLKHDRIAIRELARWHLERLLPKGRDIPFDAAAPAEERDKAWQAWKALIEKPRP